MRNGQARSRRAFPAAVLSGHIHTFLAAQERGRLMFSAPSNRNGDYLDIAFEPA